MAAQNLFPILFRTCKKYTNSTMLKFGPLGNVAKVTTVQERINERFDHLFHYDRSGRQRALVCTFCEEYLLSSHDVNYLQIERVKKNQDLFYGPIT
jgi:hypothetical protein